MEVIELQFGHRKVCLYRLVQGTAPLVYSIDYHENGQLLLEACKQLECEGFNLVTISGLHWNQELSPWPVETVVSRDMFLDKILELTKDKNKKYYIGGYSLAGLFALWTAHQTGQFSRILSASGSMWYPGWLEYVQEHYPAVALKGVYLSVEEQESTSRNAVLHTVGERTRAVAELMAERGIPTKFELNPGNHFKNPPLRIVKGIKWLLENT